MAEILCNMAANDLQESEQKKLTSTLNVTTILTFIGCGVAVLSQLVAFFGAQSNYDKAIQASADVNNNSSSSNLAKSLIGPKVIEMFHRELIHKTPILLIGLAGVVLCLIGAILMRSLKKRGFPIYAVGELLPFAAYYFIQPTGLSAMIGMMVTVVVVIVFLGLYVSQLRYMK